MQLTMLLDKNCLLVTAVGTVDTYEDMFHYAKTVLDEASEYNIKRILLDETGLKNSTTSLDASILADSEDIDKAAIRGVRIANVVSPETLKISMAYENALFNRSLYCKVFTDEAHARGWLFS